MHAVDGEEINTHIKSQLAPNWADVTDIAQFTRGNKNVTHQNGTKYVYIPPGSKYYNFVQMNFDTNHAWAIETMSNNLKPCPKGDPLEIGLLIPAEEYHRRVEMVKSM